LKETSSDMSGRGWCPSTLNPRAPIFFLFARTLAYLALLEAREHLPASAAQSVCLVGRTSAKQTQRPSKNLEHQSDRGAIALNSNVKVEIQVKAHAVPYSTAELRHVLFHLPELELNAFFEQDYDVDRRLLPAPKSFANDENKHDCRAFGKPQPPSELRKSDFEVEEQRLRSANEKALF
jgi:hypothetical protein